MLFKGYISSIAKLDYFDNEVVEYRVCLTKIYSGREKGRHSFNIDQFEMRLFFGILMVSDNNVLAREKMYWENNTNVKSESISNAMSRTDLRKL